MNDRFRPIADIRLTRSICRMDDEPGLDDRLLQRLIDCRNTLIFELADQHSPPEPFASRLWEAHNIIAEVVEQIKEVAGVEEPLSGTGWTIYPDGL